MNEKPEPDDLEKFEKETRKRARPVTEDEERLQPGIDLWVCKPGNKAGGWRATARSALVQAHVIPVRCGPTAGKPVGLDYWIWPGRPAGWDHR